MTENSAPESADEETPDAGEGEPEDATETTAHEESPEAPEPGSDETEPGASEANEAEPADESAVTAGDDEDSSTAGDNEDTFTAGDGEDTSTAGDDSEAAVGDEGESAVGDGETTTSGDETPEADDVDSAVQSDATGEADEVPEPNIPDDVAAEATGDATADYDVPEDASESAAADSEAAQAVPEDVQKYARFQKMDGAQYERVNEFLRERTYVTAREWAIARLCADFRTETGVEMTKIGQNLPRLVPFMTDTYTPQAVNQARASFEEKVNKAGATFLYGAMCGFFTAEDLDEMMYEVTEVAKFLLEVEGVDLSVEEELAAEDKISEVMREVRQSSAQVRGEEVKCPECGHVHDPN